MGLKDLALQFLKGDGLEVDEAGPALRVAWSGQHGRFLIAVRVDEDRQQFSCFALCPLEAGDRLEAVSELVHRLNQDLVTVAFDLDMDRGTIRCRGGIDLDGVVGVAATTTQLGPVFYAVGAAMDQALPALTAVIVKKLQPRRAMAAVV